MNSAYTECVACSGELVADSETSLAIVEICQSCGGMHLTTNYDAYFGIVTAMNLVDQKSDEIRYFDVMTYDGDHRSHGWVERSITNVVQFG